jgi:hypothetical protein
MGVITRSCVSAAGQRDQIIHLKARQVYSSIQIVYKMVWFCYHISV